ncbi:aarF domain-containing kinase 1 [Anthonomus grandis grandis]|uniref:aarF domain-containing kinase 1 n=1 Tax=Anthonomus grandis grandis TaxID=2921223 RepID=UPI002165CC72|nr:aarF domain-containing kinase 1 [Anthonomus grandis grandis]
MHLRKMFTISRIKPLLKYALVGGAIGSTALSLKRNQYEWDSIGVVRLSRAAVTVFKIGVIYKFELYGPKLDKKTKEYLQLKSVCHKKCAEKLLDLCCANKGVYIKVGQYIAALDYLLPTEYVETMKILHSHAPTTDMKDIYRVIREDLKKDPFEIFESIDPQPLGTASLAQVHRAVLKDGTVLAIKVQHPYVQGNSRVDMKTMEYLVKLMTWVFPEFKFQWLVDESKKNIPIELNFNQEGKNSEKVAKMFENIDWLKVPKVRWDLSTTRVLTMEFVEGGQVNDLNYIKAHNIDPYEISSKLGKLYSEMIFIHGFVHSDPHPGNILVRKNEKGSCDILLLDHGLYAVLKDDFRINYANLWLSILDRDRKGMRLYSQNLGIQGDIYGLFACMVTGRTWDTIMKGIEREQFSSGEKDFVQANFTGLLPQISSVLENVNRQMLLILKTNDLMRGIEYTLRTSARMGAFRVMSQCCVQSIYSDRLKKCQSKVQKFKLSLAELWILLKIRLYYAFLNLKQFF